MNYFGLWPGFTEGCAPPISPQTDYISSGQPGRCRPVRERRSECLVGFDNRSAGRGVGTREKSGIAPPKRPLIMFSQLIA